MASAVPVHLMIKGDFSGSENGQHRIGHFVKIKYKNKLHIYIDIKWREMRFKVIFAHSKWPLVILRKKSSYFRVFKMVCRGHFLEKK